MLLCAVLVQRIALTAMAPRGLHGATELRPCGLNLEEVLNIPLGHTLKTN